MARAGLDADAVVQAAAELADADGAEGLTLAGLAQRLGVRVPSLYSHVGGLADLRARLAVRGCEQLHDALAHAAAGRAGADALRAVAEAYRTYALAHPGTYAAIQIPPADRPDVAAAAARVIDVLGAVLRGYGLEGDDAVHATRALRGALHGFISLQQQGGFQMDIPVQESWERLITMLDRGLAAQARTPAPA